jgi:OmpA-OmpF porin, OOP family
MKTLIQFAIVILLTCITAPAHSQLDVIRKARKKVEQKTDEKVDEELDKIFNTKNKEGTTETQAGPQSGTSSDQSTSSGSDVSVPAESSSEPVAKTGVLSWAKYDFIPGDKIIFEDDLKGEENGEFPSRWDLSRGVIEVAELDGQNVIMFRGGQPTIIPYLENSNNDYLPDVFTVEFDMYLGGTSGWSVLYLFDRKNQADPSGQQDNLQIHKDGMEMYGSNSKYPGSTPERNRWIHVAVAYTDGKFKAYMDDTRLINIPRLDINPSGISLYSYHANDQSPIYFRNIRIAEGGVKYYDRVLEDGKIVANGIRFDVGKATLKPESMGVINEVVDLMKEHSDLKFSIEGHTDSDGNDDLNLDLSQKRSETVMTTMVGLGIAKERLQAKGLGETNPVSENTTAEGKANNRRVEFVKL